MASPLPSASFYLQCDVWIDVLLWSSALEMVLGQNILNIFYVGQVHILSIFYVGQVHD